MGVAKAPDAGPESVYRHLERSTHRFGLSNNRLLCATAAAVTIRTRGEDLRFLQHVVPLPIADPLRLVPHGAQWYHPSVVAPSTASAPEPPRVLVYRTAFLPPSEAFIVEQVSHLRRYQPVLVARTLEATAPPVPFPVLALGRRGEGRWRQWAYTLTRDPRLLPRAVRRLRPALVHAYFGPDGVLAVPLARHLKCPLVVSILGNYDIASRRSFLLSGRISSVQYALRFAELAREASLFLCISDSIAAQVRALGVPAQKVVTHSIGVDVHRLVPPPAARRARDAAPTLLSVARHVPGKGLDVLLRAFAQVRRRLPRARLIQVGSGPLEPLLHALARELNLAEAVDFMGSLPHARLLALQQEATAFVMPSVRTPAGNTEGLPISILEAMATGLPCVATRHGGIPEAIRDGETGLLCEEHDVAGLTVALCRVLEDGALRAGLAMRARAEVEAHYDLHRLTETLEAHYDRAVASFGR